MHQEYNTTYGLAIEGLVRHNKIDPLEYNSQVDDALPLDSIIFPDPQLRKLLQDVDTTKVKLWLFTNAYKTHGNRVVELLGVEDLFEGMTFCDYAQAPLICKPQPLMFAKAMREAGVKNHKDCYFIGKASQVQKTTLLICEDDSATNCRKSEALGWTAIHLVEDGESLPTRQACRYSVRSLEELRTLFPKFFKTS